MFIDIITNKALVIDEVRDRFMPVIYSDTEQLTLAQLHSRGVAKLVENPAPEVFPPYESLQEKWTKVTGKWTRCWSVKLCSLDDARRYRQAEIEQIYQRKKLDPVAYDGKYWTGGYESAQVIMGSIEMREFVGQDSVTLYDISGTATPYTLMSARHVALAIGTAYEIIRAKKAELTLAINTAETVGDVRAVEWV